MSGIGFDAYSLRQLAGSLPVTIGIIPKAIDVILPGKTIKNFKKTLKLNRYTAKKESKAAALKKASAFRRLKNT